MLVLAVRASQDAAISSLSADEVFPHFITQELPTGMAGIVISGALAAAMSSLDSSLNAISSVVVVDFARPLCPTRSDKQQLRLGRFVTAATTVLMVVVALLFRAADKTAMFGASCIQLPRVQHRCVASYERTQLPCDALSLAQRPSKLFVLSSFRP
jgi:SSS family solute:Na+ symporter